MKPHFTGLLALLLLPVFGFGQSLVKGVSYEFMYTGDWVTNLSGGISRGSAYLGKFEMTLNINAEKAGLWKGSSMCIHPVNTHGGTPSATLTGDFQGISNIEAGDLTYFHELWIQHEWKNVSLTAGLQDLNAEFAVSEVAGLFLNGSFGVHSTIADNIPSPIFPLTALGLQFQWKISKMFQVKLAAFDGLPDDFQDNPYNTSWKLNKQDGVLSIAELTMPAFWSGPGNGTLKTGVYYHQHQEVPGAEDYLSAENNYGGYLVAEQCLNPGSESFKTNAFLQFSLSPMQKNDHCCYLGAGLHTNGFSKKRPSDEFGLAVAHARFHQRISKAETIFEISYKTLLCNRIYLQPDIQYIMNPSGTETVLPNAWVGIFRTGIIF